MVGHGRLVPIALRHKRCSRSNIGHIRVVEFCTRQEGQRHTPSKSRARETSGNPSHRREGRGRQTPEGLSGPSVAACGVGGGRHSALQRQTPGGEGDSLDPESHPGPTKLGSTVAVDGFFRALGLAWPPFAIGENAMSPGEAALVPRQTASRNAPFLAVDDVGRLAVASRAHRMRMTFDIDSRRFRAGRGSKLRCGISSALTMSICPWRGCEHICADEGPPGYTAHDQTRKSLLWDLNPRPSAH